MEIRNYHQLSDNLAYLTYFGESDFYLAFFLKLISKYRNGEMVPLLLIVNIVVIGLVYVFFMRLSARWTLHIKLARKTTWIFYGIVLLIAFINAALAGVLHRSSVFSAAVFVQLILGGWYFGKFAVNEKGVRPGFVKGLIMTSVGLIMITVAIFILLVLSKLLLRLHGA